MKTRSPGGEVAAGSAGILPARRQAAVCPNLALGIKGTEFQLRVFTGATRIDLFEGVVEARNQAGGLTLTSLQAVIATAVEPPRLIELMEPADAVQWALYYTPLLGTLTHRRGDADLRAAAAAAIRGDSTFERAVRLDQADPLPRMGLALALIRDGRLIAGREQPEIAVALDPRRSLPRSYLGKAFYEEKRNAAAQVQIDLAAERERRAGVIAAGL